MVKHLLRLILFFVLAYPAQELLRIMWGTDFGVARAHALSIEVAETAICALSMVAIIDYLWRRIR